MVQELMVFGIIFAISLILHRLISKGNDIQIFRSFILRFMYIGVVIHEVSHYLVSLLVGIKPKEIEIRYRYKKIDLVSPHGHVTVRPHSFLQGVLITFAPLYISTWLAVFFFFIMFSPQSWWAFRVLAGMLLISTMLGAAPSHADLRMVLYSVRNDPLFTLYQIFLVIVSAFILWAILYYFEIVFILDVFYYLSIAAIYWELKIGLMGISKVLFILRSRSKKPHKIQIKRLARRRYKPKKPHKIGIEEAEG